jgi:hypothetical protein
MLWQQLTWVVGVGGREGRKQLLVASLGAEVLLCRGLGLGRSSCQFHC